MSDKAPFSRASDRSFYRWATIAVVAAVMLIAVVVAVSAVMSARSSRSEASAAESTVIDAAELAFYEQNYPGDTPENTAAGLKAEDSGIVDTKVVTDSEIRASFANRKNPGGEPLVSADAVDRSIEAAKSKLGDPNPTWVLIRFRDPAMWGLWKDSGADKNSVFLQGVAVTRLNGTATGRIIRVALE